MQVSDFIRYAMLSDVGLVRSHNEDVCVAAPDLGLFIVCDGMGGAAGGEIAAAEASASFLARVRQMPLSGSVERRLIDAMTFANRAVFDRALREPSLHGMGTTLVALEVEPDARNVWVAHAGDSRCYRMRDGVFTPLTADHSLVEEQMRDGFLTQEEARRSHLRNVITRVVGSQPYLEPAVARHAAQTGDLYLLCSDGLTRDLEDADLENLLRRSRSTLDDAAHLLVQVARQLGGGDNITVLLVEIVAPAS